MECIDLDKDRERTFNWLHPSKVIIPDSLDRDAPKLHASCALSITDDKSRIGLPCTPGNRARNAIRSCPRTNINQYWLVRVNVRMVENTPANWKPIRPECPIGTLTLHKTVESLQGRKVLTELGEAIRLDRVGVLEWCEGWIVRVAVFESVEIFEGLLDREEEFKESPTLGSVKLE